MMTTAIEMNPDQVQDTESNGLVKRLGVLSYGLLGYLIGCTGLFWLILGFGGLVPVGLSAFQTQTLAVSLLVNIGLIALFGLQHSLMARPAFKQWIKRLIPEAAERSTFMLMSGIVSIIAIYFWQPLPGTVWKVESTALQWLMWSAYAVAWAYLLLASFVTNHFELMGLRQVYLYFCNKPYFALPFTKKLMYRYSRHPMMLGFLIGMWSVPVMGLAQMIMAIALSLYIFIGLYFEERDLTKQFGDVYRQYKKEIARFIPGIY